MDATNPSLLFLFLLLLLGRGLSLVAAGSYRNLTAGSSLTSSGPNSSIFSPTGDFAFGFWPLDANSSIFLLAVWFNNTSPQVVVWFATNNTNPVQVPAKSTLQLTQAGQLSLSDSNGREVWSPNAANATGVSLLDSGNLVLYDSSGALPWQSFQNPTDTILPGQSLGERSELRSKLTDSDFSFGRFMLAVQDDGNLVFYPVAVSTGSEYYGYWASNTQNATKLQLVFNSSGSLYYQVENGSQIPLVTSTPVYSPANFYQHATLDPDGALRLYTYPKNNNNGKSTDTWAVVGMLPTNPCLTIQTDGGGGACGLNAYCNSDDDQSKQLDCKCVSGCKFVDTNRPYLGCTPNFTVQSCDEYQSSQYTFNEILNMDWPEDSYEHYAPTDEDTCRASCLADCFCSVAVFQGSKCSKKKMPLSNGRQGMTVGGNALIKVPRTNASFLTQGPKNPITMVKKDRSMLILVISALLGSSGFLNMLFIIAAAIISFSICNRTKDKKNPIDPAILGWSNLIRAFTYKELEDATDNFREELGSGGFGIVYKGVLAAEFRTAIAVKKLDRAAAKDSEQEFTNEVRSIAQTHHKNLVKLLGFCNEGSHRMLVYEYMSNGSLTSFLFGSTRPEWKQRAQIVVGIARGLSYLHEECAAQIIHCDIKSQNILLDDDFIPKISDFGLAKLLRADQTRTNTAIRGTKGYVAPEWFKNSAVTAKVDVYSFGVLLLEIICCRKNVQTEATTEEAAVLAYWAQDCFRNGRLDLLVDGDGEAMVDAARVERFVTVAIWCILEEPSLRPSMRKVAQMLEGAVAVPVPPNPSSYISSIL